ncbi:hypothetical protein F5Y15DRAFT_215559 [Xylariaceae sp. FL0016]|nr:hypothetical protein F5Y15DRAFT_215559 [Xylariaceae sp. FL0016]
MASTTIDQKALKSGQLTVATTQVAPTPSTEKLPQVSMEMHRDSNVSSPSSAHLNNGFDTDVEAMMPAQSSDNLNKTTTGTTRSHNKQDCTVWPGQAHWKQKARAAKIKNRSCQCMARLSKRTRIIVKIAIVLLIVGIAVGVGFGISKPLGAQIWQPSDD